MTSTKREFAERDRRLLVLSRLDMSMGMPDEALIATLESGGTKMVAAFSSGPSGTLVRERIPTTTPEETIGRLVDFFTSASAKLGVPVALVVGTFGPADLNPESPTYGFITSTPKAGWANADLLGPLSVSLGKIPTVFETDVNAALLGEATWGAARGLKNAAYFTVGTGIGGGLLIDGRLVHGVGHSEMGHMRVKKNTADHFIGSCPFHQDCLEGLASGSSIQERWGVPASDLDPEHPAWEIEADYLAQACLNLLMIAPPERIVLGGGVMHQAQLFPMIRARLKVLLDDYLSYDFLNDDLDSFIVPPELGDDAGLLGCVALGQELLKLNRVP